MWLCYLQPPAACAFFHFLQFTLCFLFFTSLLLEEVKKRKRNKRKRNATGAASGLHLKRGSVFGDHARRYSLAKRNDFSVIEKEKSKGEWKNEE